MNYQAEFALQTLMFVSRMAASGDYETPHRLGIRNDQLEKLLCLSAQEIHEMASISKACFVQLSIDPQILDTAMTICSQRIQQRQLMIQMLKAGASFPVLKHFFGLSGTEYTHYRKYLALPKADGRPTLPNEAEQAQIWQLWKSCQDEQLSIPERLLWVNQQTQIKINAIWPLIQEWFADCESDITV